MSATLHDIAEKAGVSVSTVSRVLNKKARKYRISPTTEAQVLEAARALEYRPNHMARGLRLKKSNTIGLITPDISNPFFAYITKRVQNVAYERGYSLVVCNTDENQALEVEHVSMLYRDRIDGLIAMPVGQKYDHFQEWLGTGRSLVLLDRCFNEIEANSVVVDNYGGAFEAVEYLIRHGHRRIAIIQGLPGTYTSRARLHGYRDALESGQIPADPSLIVGRDFRQQNGYIEMKLLLNQAEPPTAVFATSDLITLGVLHAVAEEGLSIPEDLSLITFDDFDFAPFLKCPLTAVRQPKEMMGELAVKLLVETLGAAGPAPKRIVLKTSLVQRDSVAAPRADAPNRSGYRA